MLCKKKGIPGCKWKSHSSEDCFFNISNQAYTRERLRISLGNRADDVKKYQKTEKNWKRELKSLKKLKKVLHRIAKNSGSRREINNTKKIKNKAYKKHSYYIIDNSSSDLDSDLSLSSDSELE